VEGDGKSRGLEVKEERGEGENVHKKTLILGQHFSEDPLPDDTRVPAQYVCVMIVVVTLYRNTMQHAHISVMDD
jgi:hypothetical protein